MCRIYIKKVARKKKRRKNTQNFSVCHLFIIKIDKNQNFANCFDVILRWRKEKHTTKARMARYLKKKLYYGLIQVDLTFSERLNMFLKQKWD
jgi:hypothetical protein